MIFVFLKLIWCEAFLSDFLEQAAIRWRLSPECVLRAAFKPVCVYTARCVELGVQHYIVKHVVAQLCVNSSRCQPASRLIQSSELVYPNVPAACKL